MKLTLFFTLILTICNAQLNSETTSYIDSMMNAYGKPNNPGAVVLVAQNGKVLYRKAFGMANLELEVPMKSDHSFMIGSMTKQFTAVCILQLVQQGKIQLEDDIKKHIPTYNTHERHISIENLLTHTSGIPEWNPEKYGLNTNQDMTREQIINTFQNDSLYFEPGSWYQYSNEGYYLLGVLVENVTGMSLDQYLKKNIFDVLGMTHSYLSAENRSFHGLVTGYYKENDIYFPAPYWNKSWPFSAGAIISSVDDLLKWNEALYTDVILDQKWIQKAQTTYVLKNGMETGYGYGWWAYDFLGIKYASHGGKIPGFLASGIRIPSEHLYVVVLQNDMMNDNYNFVPQKIAFRMAGRPLEVTESFPITPAKLKEYVGVYLSEDFNNDIMTQTFYKDGKLYIKGSGGMNSELLYIGNDAFCQKGQVFITEFHRDENNKVISEENHGISHNPSDVILKRTDKPFKSYVLLESIMREIINEKGIDAAIKKFHELRTDPKSGCYFQEVQLNNLGYECLQAKKIKEAIALFELNTREYPNSWNVYDSLAEAYMANGQNQLAIENYVKSIQLNTENLNGIEVLKKLKEGK
jgi:CubicO group peptidase (beta-lactamase class C family)